MDVQSSINHIISIEKRIDVSCLTYKDLRLWPLIRLELWTRLTHPDRGGGSTEKNGSRLFRSVPTALRILGAYVTHWKNSFSQTASFKSSAQLDVLFLSRAEDYTTQVQGRSYNLHIDPLIEFVRNKYRFLKLELTFDRGPERNQRIEATIFQNIGMYLLAGRLKRLLGFGRSDSGINGFSELKRLVRETTGIVLDENFFIQQAELVFDCEAFLSERLNQLRPKAVILICYYFPINMALIRACRKLNIVTVDVQHGKQGQYHGMYTHWTRVPKDGYDLLPDYFWVWGEDSGTNITKWMPADSPHRAIVGGNRWLADWVHGRRPADSAEFDAFSQRLSGYDRVILVTLQPLEDPLPTVLMEAMKQSPDSWIWLVRLHPHQGNQKEGIAGRLQGVGAHVEMDLASTLPLYGLLGKSDFHVTAFSSVCYEALAFKVHTAIVHPTGRSLYGDYIDRGLFSTAESGKELIGLIRKDRSAYSFEEPRPYIETSDAAAEAAFETILTEAGR